MSSELECLFQEDWDWEMNDNPEFASQAGKFDTKPSVYLQNLSPASYTERSKHSKEMLAKIDAILSKGGLTSHHSIFAQLFRNMHAELVESIDNHPLYLIPINSIGVGCVAFSFSESVEWLRFDSVNDFELYLKKLHAFHAQVDETIECMREGVKRGYVASKATVVEVESQLQEIIDGDLSPLKQPLETETAKVILSGSNLLSELRDAIEDTKRGYRKFLHFFLDEYSKALRESPACSSLPNGAALYQQCLRFHTTTDMTADEIHAVGLAEVERIEARIRGEVLAPLGFAADQFPAFVEQVR
jgi:uncharacterized protein (DUF885 family)